MWHRVLCISGLAMMLSIPTTFASSTPPTPHLVAMPQQKSLRLPNVGKSNQLSGSVSQGRVQDYTFQGNEGQALRISLQGSDSRVYFLLWQIEKSALVVPDTRDWWGTLPEEGKYLLRVYTFEDELNPLPHQGSYPFRLRIQQVKPKVNR